MHAPDLRDPIRQFFAAPSSVEVDEGLKPMTFGEFLVDSRAIDRYQLLCALQVQAQNPGVRIGECIAALGYLPYPEVERHLSSWKQVI